MDGDSDSYTGGDDSNYGNEGANYSGTDGLNAATDGIFGGISSDPNVPSFDLSQMFEQAALNYGQDPFGAQAGLNFGEQADYGDPFGVDSLSFSPEAPDLGDRAKAYALNALFGKAKGMAAAQFGIPMPAINAIMAFAKAPEGEKSMAALNKGFESILDSTLFAMPNLFNGIANTITGQNNPSFAQGLMSQGGYKGGDGYANSFSEANMNSPNGGYDWMGLAGGLGGLYSMYSQNQGANKYVNSLQSMYGQQSPYAQQLRQQLARKDAAAGRRSQYGPREVELQARLAQLQTQLAPSIMQGQQNQFGNGLKMFQQLGAMNKAGLFDGLKGLFRTQQSPFTMPDTAFSNPSLAPVDTSFSDQSGMNWGNVGGGGTDWYGTGNMDFSTPDTSMDW